MFYIIFKDFLKDYFYVGFNSAGHFFCVFLTGRGVSKDPDKLHWFPSVEVQNIGRTLKEIQITLQTFILHH
jgi:hypothetical protein